MGWFLLFLTATLAYAAFRVWLSVGVVRAQRVGDTEREARLAALAFKLRVGYLGAVLVGLVVLLAVGLALK